MADQLGVDLVRIVGFNEGFQPAPYYSLEKSVIGMGSGDMAPVIETGENKVEISVSIIYEIN